MLSHERGIRELLESPKSIFNLLTAEEREELKQHIKLTHYKKDEYIFKEGEKPSMFLFLVKGKIKIFKEGVGGREQIIRMTSSMGIIGYRALLAGQSHIASAFTIDDSTVCSISAEILYNHLLKNPDFSSKIIKLLAEELGFSNLRMVTLTQKHIRGRLAESLLLLKDNYGFENDGATLKVYMSREDIANLSNMTTSNAIRTLSSFASEKVIAVDGRKIRVLDVKKLDRISRLG